MFFALAVFCPEESLLYQNEESENLTATFPITKAGYSSTSIEDCPAETSVGESVSFRTVCTGNYKRTSVSLVYFN